MYVSSSTSSSSVWQSSCLVLAHGSANRLLAWRACLWRRCTQQHRERGGSYESFGGRCEKAEAPVSKVGLSRCSDIRYNTNSARNCTVPTSCTHTPDPPVLTHLPFPSSSSSGRLLTSLTHLVSLSRLPAPTDRLPCPSDSIRTRASEVAAEYCKIQRRRSPSSPPCADAPRHVLCIVHATPHACAAVCAAGSHLRRHQANRVEKVKRRAGALTDWLRDGAR